LILQSLEQGFVMNVKDYELQQVMCQHDEIFIDILNRFQTTSYMIKDISFMNKCCLRTSPSNNTLPRLFSINVETNFHNQKKLIITSRTFKFLAQDIHSDTCFSHFKLFSTSNEIGGLHYELLLKK